jgi:hypothetical protein
VSPSGPGLRQGEFATEERLDLDRSCWADSLGKLSELLAAGE